MWRRAGSVVLPLVWLASAGAGSGLAIAATETPAAQQQKITDAVAQLSSADPAEREEASRVLWAAGDAARDALKEAAEGDDVEVARRAAELLRNLRYGIRPDTPKAVIDLLSAYRQEDRAAVQAAVTGLATRGEAGLRVLGRLWQEEGQPWRREVLAQALAERARAAVPLLLADASADPGQVVLPLLEAAAEAPVPTSDQAPRDLAAFLLARGDPGLDAHVARLKTAVADNASPAPQRSRAAAQLAHLCRARADLPAARWAAEQSGDAPLLESFLIETGDWKAMAERVGARLGGGAARAASIDDLAYAAAYHRLARDEQGLAKWAAQIAAYAERRPDDNWSAAEALILNDRPEDGVALLLKHRNYDAAAPLLPPRMQFKELFELGARAAAEKPTEAAKIEARAAATRHFLGDRKAASETLHRLLDANDPDRDFELYLAIAEAASATRDAALAEEAAMRALGAARPTDDLEELFERAGLNPGARAARWWALMRLKYKEPPRVTFGRLRSLLGGKLPQPQVEILARAAAEEAMRRQTAERDAWLLDVGQMLLDLGLRESAKTFFQKLNSAPAPPTPVPLAFLRLGDIEAEDGHWDAAATLYGRAWEMDKTQALPLLLRGNALTHVGRQKEGRELVERAHLMPLADEAERHELMTGLEARKLTAEARRERDLIVRTGGMSSWNLSDTLRRVGDEAYEKGDYATAATLWDRAFLDNQSRSTRFADPWANFSMPSLVHRARVLGMMRSGDFDGAKQEAELAMRYTPADADGLIAFVTELDKLGRRADADELFKRYTAPYRAACEAYPDSGQSHNQLAWAQAKCRRELDDALKHARRAAELEPDNTASLDTLAETYYQRGQYQQAVETINRCIELEPKEKHHAEQLERFSKALGGNGKT